MKKILTILFAALALGGVAFAQTYDTNNVVAQTIAGSAFTGTNDGQGTLSMFNGPVAVAADSSSNLFVFDYNNLLVRKITPAGVVSTIAGGGTINLPVYNVVEGHTNTAFVPGLQADLDPVVNMTMSSADRLYMLGFTASNTVVLYRMDSDGYVAAIPFVSSDLTGGQARHGICADSQDHLFVSNMNTHKIYRITTNGISLFVGSGNVGAINGTGAFTSFNGPAALCADPFDNLFVWDSGNKLIRKITPGGEVTTYAGHSGSGDNDGQGTNAGFFYVSTMTSDAQGNLYLACFSSSGGESIRKIYTNGRVTTLAGNFSQHGYVNGTGSTARFYGGGNEGLCWSGGSLFLADTFNHRIRQLTFNPVPQPVYATNLSVATYAGLNITGTVGRTYQVQSTTDNTNWLARTNVLLTISPQLWIDPTAAVSNRFYRIFLLP